MKDTDFDLRALYVALDELRRSRSLSWAAVAREISQVKTNGNVISPSTISSLKSRNIAEGDGVLQLLLWLDRTPESFVPGFHEAEADRYRLKKTGPGRILRWDTRALYEALNAKRESRGMTWNDAAKEIGGFTAAMLTHLRDGGRAKFPAVMRMVRWLNQPAATFTRESDR